MCVLTVTYHIRSSGCVRNLSLWYQVPAQKVRGFGAFGILDFHIRDANLCMFSSPAILTLIGRGAGLEFSRRGGAFNVHMGNPLIPQKTQQPPPTAAQALATLTVLS